MLLLLLYSIYLLLPHLIMAEGPGKNVHYTLLLFQVKN